MVRGIGEATLADRRGPAEDEEAIGSLPEEVGRLSRLGDTLLRLSHGDAGTVRLSVTRSTSALWPARSPHLAVSSLRSRTQSVMVIAADDIGVPVDRLVLREAPPVLDNAIKYSRDSEFRIVLPVATTGAVTPSRSSQGLP